MIAPLQQFSITQIRELLRGGAGEERLPAAVAVRRRMVAGIATRRVSMERLAARPRLGDLPLFPLGECQAREASE
jgi:hypothetical protein